ncbi:hypothetical protein MTO96_052363, partial [Rhipicephalus appendiculatus]
MRMSKVLEEIKENEDLDERHLFLVHRVPSRFGPVEHVRHVVKRVSGATWLLSEESLPGQLVFSSSGPSRPIIVQTTHSGPRASDTELEVVPAKWLFHELDMYRMVLYPRGTCIIINNCNFDCYDEPRYGSELDVQNMEHLFNEFLFKCVVHKDKTADEMKELLSEVAQSQEQEGAECLVIILMSHGNQDTIEGVDNEELHLIDDVYAKFNNKNCPALQGKPKLFFIQACRGEEWDNGTNAKGHDASDTRPVPAEKPQLSSSIGQKPLITWSDMYIAYAAIPGYRSLRNREFGSWFLSAVYKVFSEHAATMHLDELMERVHDEVLQKSSDDGEKQTPSVETQGWTKELYFNPRKFVHAWPGGSLTLCLEDRIVRAHFI